MIETINPANEQEWLELRCKDVTSSEVGALFGISPYVTAFELWHRKKEGKVVITESEEWTNWGQRLQDAIAAGVAKDNGWEVRKMTEYMRDSELKIGASFDFSIESFIAEHPEPHEGQMPVPHEGKGILEIKNVFGLVFKDQWLEDEDGNFEAPPHIEIQVQHQLAVSGRAFCYIAALVSGNKIILIKRLPDPKIIGAIKKKVAEFWASIESNTPPSPNFNLDAEFIAQLYGYAEPGKIFDARGNEDFNDLCMQHRAATETKKEMDLKREEIKSRLLMMMGDAEKVVGEVGGDKFTISAGLIGECDMSYVRSGYRNFKINWPRGKKKE